MSKTNVIDPQFTKPDESFYQIALQHWEKIMSAALYHHYNGHYIDCIFEIEQGKSGAV